MRTTPAARLKPTGCGWRTKRKSTSGMNRKRRTPVSWITAGRWISVGEGLGETMSMVASKEARLCHDGVASEGDGSSTSFWRHRPWNNETAPPVAGTPSAHETADPQPDTYCEKESRRKR